jgi:phosphohistidine swiveling domain-containing protein
LEKKEKKKESKKEALKGLILIDTYVKAEFLPNMERKNLMLASLNSFCSHLDMVGAKISHLLGLIFWPFLH